MLAFFNRPKFPTALFVIAAIANLIILLMLFIGFGFLWNGLTDITAQEDYVFDQTAFEQSDPLVTKVPKFEDALRAPIVSDLDPYLGPKNAAVVLVQFSDFECEYCQEQEKTLKRVLNDYKDNVRLVWKDFPASNPSSVSFQAAVAARCAQKQDKFWQYHDTLYENTNRLKDNIFTDLAERISLDIAEFEACRTDPLTAKAVLDNIYEANALDITGIPFIYINDQEMLGQLDYNDLKQMIDRELGKNLN